MYEQSLQFRTRVLLPIKSHSLRFHISVLFSSWNVLPFLVNLWNLAILIHLSVMCLSDSTSFLPCVYVHAHTHTHTHTFPASSGYYCVGEWGKCLLAARVNKNSAVVVSALSTWALCLTSWNSWVPQQWTSKADFYEILEAIKVMANAKDT